MAGENGQETHSLADPLTGKLKSNPFRFDFFRALRLLENRHRHFPKIGSTISPEQDPVRFGQNPELSFPTSTLEGMERKSPDRPWRLNVRFFGLFGPNGPLPTHFTEYARDRLRNMRDFTISAFADIFHHRLISFFYRAWAVNQKAVDFDRPEESRYTGYIGSFFGYAEESLRNRDSIGDNAKLYYSGRLSSQTKSADGLEAVLADYFSVPVAIESFVGHQLAMPEAYWCRLGGERDNALLGVSAVLGSHVWDVQNRFRVRIGPVGFRRFTDFLPAGRSFLRLTEWIAFYTSHQFQWDLNLVLAAGEIPQTGLGGGSLLGYTTWLKSGPSGADSDDLIINPPEARTQLTHPHTS